MIQILLLSLMAASAMAQYGHGGGYGGGYGGHGGGYGGGYGYEPKYPPAPYSFGYEVKDGYNAGLNQKEEGDAHGNKKGSYGYTDGYGIYRQVDYVADEHGFRATVKTNEPGTANQNPADVYIHSSAAPHDYAPAPYKAQSYGIASYAPSIGHGGGYGGGYGGGLIGGLGGHGGYGAGLTLGNGGYGGGYGGDIYKATSYAAPLYAAPKLAYGGHGGGYAIPAVHYAKGY